jgi:hypothetical protein
MRRGLPPSTMKFSLMTSSQSTRGAPGRDVRVVRRPQPDARAEIGKAVHYAVPETYNARAPWVLPA